MPRSANRKRAAETDPGAGQRRRPPVRHWRVADAAISGAPEAHARPRDAIELLQEYRLSRERRCGGLRGEGCNAEAICSAGPAAG